MNIQPEVKGGNSSREDIAEIPAGPEENGASFSAIVSKEEATGLATTVRIQDIIRKALKTIEDDRAMHSDQTILDYVFATTQERLEQAGVYVDEWQGYRSTNELLTF